MSARIDRLHGALRSLRTLITKASDETSQRIYVEIKPGTPPQVEPAPGVSSHAFMAIVAAYTELHHAFCDVPFIQQLSPIIRLESASWGIDTFELEVLQETVIDDEDECARRIILMAERLEAAALETPPEPPAAHFEITIRTYSQTYDKHTVPATSPRQAVLLCLAAFHSGRDLDAGLRIVCGVRKLCPQETWSAAQ